jgi:uncharacterized protein (TIGR00251 family)
VREKSPKRQSVVKPKSPAKSLPRARLAVKLQPGASRNAVIAKTGDEWKLAVTAPPVDGRANEACILLLSEVWGVRRSAITIVRGQTSRKKIVEIQSLAADEIERLLACRVVQ